MRLFLIAIAVAYVIMVGFAETLRRGSQEVLSSVSPVSGYSVSAQSISVQSASTQSALTEGASAHSLVATPSPDGAPERAACVEVRDGDEPAAAGCAETRPRR